MKRITKRIVIGSFLLLIAMGLIILCVLIYQGKNSPRLEGQYVALGSSFAAGAGLGVREPESPIICFRSSNGYPQQLAHMLNLSLVDMSCSGATIKHVRQGGQVFLGPQLDALGPNTQLVTLTAGGNDVGYVGDLTMMAYRRKAHWLKFLIDWQWTGASVAELRQFSELENNLLATLTDIIRRAPHAKVVLVTYPTILPIMGNCEKTGLTDSEVTLMREVAARFADVQRAAAQAANVNMVDMEKLSRAHDICSQEPWVNGSSPLEGAPFHPTLSGAKAVAEQVRRLLNTSD